MCAVRVTNVCIPPGDFFRRAFVVRRVAQWSPASACRVRIVVHAVVPFSVTRHHAVFIRGCRQDMDEPAGTLYPNLIATLSDRKCWCQEGNKNSRNIVNDVRNSL